MTGFQVLVVHAIDDRDVFVGRRGGDQDFFGSGFEVFGGVVALGEAA